MKLIQKLSLIINQDTVNKILIPRKVIFSLFVLQILFLSICMLLWRGVWILVAIPLILLFAGYERFYLSLWKRYYAALTFALQFIAAAVLSYGIKSIILIGISYFLR